MTISFACSEDSGLTLAGGATNTTTDARYNANLSRHAIRCNGTGPNFACVGASAFTDFWLHISWASRFADDDGNNMLRFYNSSGTEVFRVDVVAPSEDFQAYYWNGSSFVAVGSSWFMDDSTSGGVHELVIHIECGGSGAFEAFYDGALVDSGAVASASVDNIKEVRFYDSDSSTTFGTFYSEMIFSDEALVGATLETQWPTGNGTDADGTGAYTDVDEATRSDVDYIVLANVGEKQSITYDAFTETQDAVLAYVLSATIGCDASGPSQVRAYIVVGGTRYYSSPVTVSLSILPYNFVWETNPATAAAWSVAQIEAVTECGIEAYA